MATQWYLKSLAGVEGPISSAELLQKVKQREITADTLIRKGDSKWTPAMQVNGLFDAAFPERASAPVTPAEYPGDH